MCVCDAFLAQRHVAVMRPDNIIREAYGAMDIHNEGAITKAGFKQLIRGYTRMVPDEVISDAFDNVDENGDGLVSWKEFESMMYARIVR